MRLCIFFFMTLLSCKTVQSEDIFIDLNDFTVIQSLEKNTIKIQGDIFVHFYQSSCSVCYAELSEWEVKFSSQEYDREDHVFILVGGDEDIVKYNILENIKICSNIYLSDNINGFKSFLGSFKAVRIDNYLVLKEKFL